MTILDRATLREIIRITCAIMRNNFFYDEETLKDFLIFFTDDFSDALIDFGSSADREIICDLYSSRAVRFDFTCYFASKVIRRILIQDFHFSEQELQAFENIVSKYTGDNLNENQPKYPRANNRKFSK